MNDIVEYIKKYRAENPTGWRKWIIGTVVTVLVIVVIAVFSIQAAQRGMELARLKSARDKAQEALRQAEVDRKLAVTVERKAALEAQADAAMERVEVLTGEIKQIEAQHKTNEEIINSIRSWEDVDRNVR